MLPPPALMLLAAMRNSAVRDQHLAFLAEDRFDWISEERFRRLITLQLQARERWLRVTRSGT